MADAPSLSRLAIVGLPPEGITSHFTEWLRRHPVAGFLLFRRDFGQAERLPVLVERLRALAAPHPVLLCADEEGGWVTQLAPDAFHLPSARVLARGATPEEAERLAERCGLELSAHGLDVAFAPVFDVETEPRNPVIGPRAFAADAGQVTRYATAVARGLRSGGVLPCAKHFPGHGATVLDSHLTLPRLEASASVLEAVHLPPFQAAVSAGVPLVMAAHVVYPALDRTGVPASLSRTLLTDLLRGRLGFRGVAITDALEMRAVAGLDTPAGIAIRALEAGADLLLYGSFTPEVEAALQGADAALAGGRLPAARIAEAEARLAALHLARPGSPAAPSRPSSDLPDLASICRGALRWIGSDGEPPSARARATRWTVVEPEWRDGKPLGARLTELGWRVEAHPWSRLSELSPEGAGELLLACPGRAPLPPEEHSWIARAVARRPVWLVAFAQDGFLLDFPAAAGRLSAGDPSAAMREAVVEALTAPTRLSARAPR